MRSGQRRKCIVGKNAHNALHLSLLRSDKLKPTVLKKMIRSILFGVGEGATPAVIVRRNLDKNALPFRYKRSNNEF